MAARNLKRLVQIYRVFAKHRCYFFLKNTKYYRPALAFGYVLAPIQSKNSITLSDGQRLALVFQELGPTFIKLGQAFSVRPDMVGEKLAEDLSRLQDKLPAFSSALAKQIVEKELGKKTTEIFKTFDEQPAAAASIAQVHFAKDMEGNEVAVKILRPNIEAKFFKDINLLFWIAKLANKKMPKFKRLKFGHFVNSLANTTKLEMDFLYEAAAADELADNFKGDENIRIPKIYWQYATAKVLVLERFSGIPIDETRKLKEAGHNLDDLLKKSSDLFLKQALRDGFFHADMHPGNVLIDKNGKICVFDFGIMGRIDRKNRIMVAELLLGFMNRDYNRIADIHFDAGVVPEGQSRELFAQACRSIGEPIFGMPQSQISIGKLLQKLFNITEQFKMEAQPQLLLLQKSIIMAEGIGRKLNPDVNYWEVSRDTLEEWGKENLGPLSRLEDSFKELGSTISDFRGIIKNLNHSITSNGIVLHPQTIETLKKSDHSESFWKGFITAIVLAILSLLMVIKF